MAAVPPADLNPYAPPRASTLSDGASPASEPRYSYRSLRGLALVSTWLMGATVLLEGASIVNARVGLGLVRAVPAGDMSTFTELVAWNRRVLALVALQFLLMVATVVPYCLLMARANRNARAFGATGLQFTPGMAAGAIFIPIFSLVWPYQAMAEVWRAADVEHRTRWQDTPVSLLVPLWWGVWVIDSLGRGIAVFVFNGPITSLQAAQALPVFGIASALLFLAVVRDLARRHDRKQQQLGGQPLSQP